MNPKTIFAILRDRFHKPSTRSLLIVTDAGQVLTLYDQSLHLHSPLLRNLLNFGLDDFLCPGFISQCHTDIGIRRPFVGQEIFVHTLAGTTATHQRIIRIYREPLVKHIPNLQLYLSGLREYFFHQGNCLKLGDLSTVPDLDAIDTLNLFLAVVYRNIASNSKFNGWTLDTPTSAHIKTLTFLSLPYPYYSKYIFSSGLLIENDLDQIVISEPLVILFMNAIQRARPDDTYFDNHGILRLK